MFSEKFKIRFSECDSTGKLTFPALVNYFQDVAGDHYYFANYSISKIREMGYYWVILSWDIEVERFPLSDETVEVFTFVNRITKNFCVRSFEMREETGTVLARATSNWVICDSGSDRMTAIPQVLIDVIQADGYTPMKRMPLSLDIKKSTLAPICSFPVTRRHLDLNGHINNVNYIRFLLDELDRSHEVKRLQICYLAAAREGENLSIFTERDNDGSAVFQIKNENGERKTEAKILLS